MLLCVVHDYNRIGAARWEAYQKAHDDGSSEEHEEQLIAHNVVHLTVDQSPPPILQMVLGLGCPLYVCILIHGC